MKNKQKISMPDHISASQISSAECLLYYRTTRLEGKYSIPSVYADEGRLGHEVIEKYVKECLRQQTDGDFESMREIFEEEANRYPSLSEETIRNLRDKLMRFAESGIKHDQILEHEKRSRIEVAGATVEVVIDQARCYRIPEGSVLEIVDFKNSRKFWTEPQVENSPQLMLYRYAAANHLYPGYDYIRSGVHHVQYNAVVWSPLKRVSDCSVEFEGTETWLLRQWKRIIEATDKELNTPTPCRLCWAYGGCPLLLDNKCAIYKKDQIDRAVNSKNIADKIRAARFHSMIGSQMVDDLKRAFDDIEPMELDGSRVGFKPTTTVKYDLAGFVAFCSSRGLHLDGLFIGKTEAERILKPLQKANMLGEKENKELESIRQESSHTTFEYK